MESYTHKEMSSVALWIIRIEFHVPIHQWKNSIPVLMVVHHPTTAGVHRHGYGVDLDINFNQARSNVNRSLSFCSVRNISFHLSPASFTRKKDIRKALLSLQR